MSGNSEALKRYYRFHAAIYDLTRWSFLFGRSALIGRLQKMPIQPRRVLEIGCGTGRNLAALARAFPKAEVVGIDVSQDMLDHAQRTCAFAEGRVLLECAPYGPQSRLGKFDVIVASYALSMMGDGVAPVLDTARRDLRQGGVFAVVDFRDSRFAFFRRWMALNHVRLDDSLLAQIQERFAEPVVATQGAYGGLWRWFSLVSR